MTDTVINENRQQMPKRVSRDFSDNDILRVLMESNPAMMHSLNFLILSEEFYWKSQGGDVIFPESPAVLDNLLRAKYQMDSPEGFRLPFSAFSVAIPNGYAFNGVRLLPFMVTFIHHRTAQDITTLPFCRKIGLREPPGFGYAESRPEAMALSITFRDPTNRHAYIRTLQLDEALPRVLKCQTAMEYKQVVGDYEDKFGVIDLTESELEAQFLAVKLVAALGVYHMATNGDRLSDGYPGSQEPRMNNRDKSLRMRFSTLRNKADVDAIEARDAFYRTWFFRQLRADRYYQGEHEKTPRGSRYSFVSDTVVGQKVTPHTQRDD